MILLAKPGTAFPSGGLAGWANGRIVCPRGLHPSRGHRKKTRCPPYRAAVPGARLHPGLQADVPIEIVKAGRSRWKIENEHNNTLKTKGYHFRHHSGHGRQPLSSLASLIILAFLTHTVLEWMDDKYRLLRQKLPSRKRLFNDIRALTRSLCFGSWEALMDFMRASFDPPTPRPETG